MNRTTKELYGIVPSDIIATRNSLAKYFIDSANKRIVELNKVLYMDRNDELITDCIKAREFWEKLISEDLQ